MAPPSFTGSNINLVKNHNLRAIMLSLLHAGQLSRVELAERTSLSSTTITNLTSELLEGGIVVEEPTERSEDPRRVGRPRTMLRLVPEARVAVGVHIGVGLFRVALTNLFAEMIQNEIHTFSVEAPAEEVLGQIAAAIEGVIAAAGVDRSRIIGVGVGASGLVDHERGVNVLAPRLQWRNLPIADKLGRSLGIPITVENNVRAMALGESLFGGGRGIDILAFVYGRTGVGAGFVVRGEIFRGSGAGAGEIGHTILLPQGGELCSCGNSGCLETLVSEQVLLAEAARIAQQSPNGPLARRLAEAPEGKGIELVFEAARQGDLALRSMITERSVYLGIALANLVNVLNPELILLGGLFAQGHDLILPVAEATVRQMAFGGLGNSVRVEVSRFGWRAGVIGAASLSLTSHFYHAPEVR